VKKLVYWLLLIALAIGVGIGLIIWNQSKSPAEPPTQEKPQSNSPDSENNPEKNKKAGDSSSKEQEKSDQPGEPTKQPSEQPVTPTISISSFFDNDDEGWTVVLPGGTGPIAPTWNPEFGSPGAEISYTGEGTWYWNAPIKFIGDISPAIGHRMAFDLNQIRSRQSDSKNLVEIESSNRKIVFDGLYSPSEAWTAYSIPLEARHWRLAGGRSVLTDTLFHQIMSNVVALRIRGSHMHNCPNCTGGLDNVVLHLAHNRPPKPDGERIESLFDSGTTDGWLITGGEFDLGFEPEYDSSIGSGGGAVFVESIGRDSYWSWLAPARFRGDLSAAYGKSLKFDLFNSALHNQTTNNVVRLEGGGINLNIDTPYAPSSSWTHYDIDLSEKAGWYHDSKRRANKNDLLTVLSDLKHLKIRGWYSSSRAGSGGLDNVAIECSGDSIPVISNANARTSFTDGDDGWHVSGGSFGISEACEWSVSNGRQGSGGRVEATGANAWYWVAPIKFRGDASSAIGKDITFSLNQSFSRNPSGFQLVILEGGGHSIYFDSNAPQKGWNEYSVPLKSSAIWRHQRTNSRVKERELREVLADLHHFRIRGWCQGGAQPGTGSLSNVIFPVD